MKKVTRRSSAGSPKRKHNNNNSSNNGLKCSNCSLSIVNDGVIYSAKTWHKHCFKCTKCNRKLAVGTACITKGNRLCCVACNPSSLSPKHSKNSHHLKKMSPKRYNNNNGQHRSPPSSPARKSPLSSSPARKSAASSSSPQRKKTKPQQRVKSPPSAKMPVLSPRIMVRPRSIDGAPKVSMPNMSPPGSPREKQLSLESTTIESSDSFTLKEDDDDDTSGSSSWLDDDDDNKGEMNTAKNTTRGEIEGLRTNTGEAGDDNAWIDIDSVFDKIMKQASSQVPAWLLRDTQCWELGTAITRIREERGSENPLLIEMEGVFRDLLFERYAHALSIRRTVRVLCQQRRPTQTLSLDIPDNVFSNVASFIYGTNGNEMLRQLEFSCFLLPWWDFDRMMQEEPGRPLERPTNIFIPPAASSSSSKKPPKQQRQHKQLRVSKGSHSDARKRMGRLRRDMSLRSAVVMDYKPDRVKDLEVTYGRYTGEVIGKIPHGEGRMEFSFGGWYEGEWKNGQHSGDGVLVYKSGSRYEGKWWKGYKHGIGTFTHVNGDMYTGHWQTNKKHGEGQFRYASGDVYSGEWYEDTRHGQGSYTFGSSGNVYTGAFVGGNAHGCGIYRYKQSGARYEGEWIDDKRHDEGLLYDKNSNVVHLKYNHGKLLWKKPLDRINAHIVAIRLKNKYKSMSNTNNDDDEKTVQEEQQQQQPPPVPQKIHRSNSFTSSSLLKTSVQPSLETQTRRSRSMINMSPEDIAKIRSSQQHRSTSLSDLPTITEDDDETTKVQEPNDDDEQDDVAVVVDDGDNEENIVRIRQKTEKLAALEARQRELTEMKIKLTNDLKNLHEAMPAIKRIAPLHKANQHNHEIISEAHQKLEHWQNALLHWQGRLNRLVKLTKNVQQLNV